MKALKLAPRSARPEEAEGPTITLRDGSSARVHDGALELRDEGGRLLVRYVDGAAEIAAPGGDLRLSAPTGRVVISSGVDVAIEAARDVAHRAGRRVDLAAGPPSKAPQLRIAPAETELTADHLAVKAKKSHVVTGHATVLARSIATTADRIATAAERYELTATRLVERSKDALREVAGLAEHRLGRARTLVKDAYALYSRRTTMASKEETTVDGSRILLG